MRSCLVAVALTMVVLMPTNGNAQAFSLPTPPPQITAASADWQIRGEPVFYAGNFYYPTGPTVFFDGNVMVRTGTYRGVALYVDATVDPYAVVYVPIGGNMMRPYERRREGELTGTVGNRVPSFPIDRDAELSVASGTTGLTTPPSGVTIEPRVLPERERPVATGGSIAPSARSHAHNVSSYPPHHPLGRTGVESIPPTRANAGVWLEFEGARYYSAGPAVPYSPSRFARIGEHGGFPVYRDLHGAATEIYVAVVKDGPLAPYKR
jgi:hypothetical protein